ncbi:hypothetical protein [Candidatus Mycolicibacterium alkanivorans]|uniref:Uncharacterized protein n=1 Tax=Candidatus Mycolicibacterium alkanivorans TaxID=2954114 RepID=A0ABS9YWA1_9MYCO|nr:hypothetical protein [Candidatus Mycolicibacterium alkanivorans]MCI4675522.1 hypothetical protein [Candidatus Mycolicibacterium alkanivorans]
MLQRRPSPHGLLSDWFSEMHYHFDHILGSAGFPDAVSPAAAAVRAPDHQGGPDAVYVPGHSAVVDATVRPTTHDTGLPPAEEKK